MQNMIFNKISEIDNLEQERLFLLQKYTSFKFPKDGLGEDNKDEKEYVNIFDLFDELNQDEKEFKKILNQKYLQETKFLVNGIEKSFEEIKTKGLKTKLNEILNDVNLNFDLILKDVLRYKTLVSQLNKQQEESISINGENIPLGTAVEYYRKEIIRKLLDDKRIKKYEEDGHSNYTKTEELDEEFLEILGLEKKDFGQVDERIGHLAWKYDFFKLVQKSVEDGYVFTHRELSTIKEIVGDLKKGKVVLLTGDTGSGKTEVARFIATHFLKKDYVFVSGSRDMEVSDITLEKTVTSKSTLTLDDNIVDGENNNNDLIKDESYKTFKKFILGKQFKDKVKEIAKTEGQNEDEINEYLEYIDLNKKSLVTEYHLMGIYKAAKLGLPCIIDEVNLIRPEVFMALNDLLTRKVGDEIQLPNALPNFEVKEGFCIILTGNDPEQNNKTKKYTSGRYNFDEASYNRLRVYAKNYLNQTIEEKKENSLEELDKTYENLYDNELYGVILMMMFKNKTKLITSGKYGFEVMKKDFEGKYLNEEGFFKKIKNFAYAISTIQKAFSGETVMLESALASKSLKDMIKRKVFSMRNLLEVLESYKDDSESLDFHVYNQFIKHTVNEEEKYALLLVFSKFGFFGDLITDNISASLKNISTKISMIDNNKRLTINDIENKFVITKQDLYKEYFSIFELEDDFFEKSQEDIKNLDQSNNTKNDNSNPNFTENIEVSKDDLLEKIQNLKTILDNLEIIFGISDYNLFSILFTIFEEKLLQNDINNNDFSILNSNFIKLNNIFEEIMTSGITEEHRIDLA